MRRKLITPPTGPIVWPALSVEMLSYRPRWKPLVAERLPALKLPPPLATCRYHIWQALQSSVGETATHQSMQLLIELGGDGWESFALRDLAHAVPMRYTTLICRFERRNLPTPSEIRRAFRSVFAATLLHDARWQSRDVATELNCSSPASFSRTLRNEYGMQAVQFAARWDMRRRLQSVLAEIVLAHHDSWSTFHPYNHSAITPVELYPSPEGGTQ